VPDEKILRARHRDVDELRRHGTEVEQNRCWLRKNIFLTRHLHRGCFADHLQSIPVSTDAGSIIIRNYSYAYDQPANPPKGDFPVLFLDRGWPRHDPASQKRPCRPAPAQRKIVWKVTAKASYSQTRKVVAWFHRTADGAPYSQSSKASADAGCRSLA